MAIKDVRLIDANEILDFINSLNFDDYNLYSEIFDYIDNAPTIDAQPVKRGKWRLVVERVITSKYACSECDSVYAIPSELSPEGFYCYCPNCGAKMRR